MLRGSLHHRPTTSELHRAGTRANIKSRTRAEHYSPRLFGRGSEQLSIQAIEDDEGSARFDAAS